MPSVSLRGLTKDYLVPEKDPGLWGSLKAVLNRRHRLVRAVDSLTLDVDEGELVGFLGENGAGKTTTLKMLSGLLTPTAGSASVLGHDPSLRESAFQKKLAFVMGQRSQLWWELPARETLRLNQAIYGLADSDFKDSLAELTELLELGPHLGIPVKKLSLGQRMRAELAAALLHRPKILLLDEPTLGLDVVMQKKVRTFLKEYNRRNRATVLLTSHNMADVVELCPRVILVDRGRLIYDGSLQLLIERYADTRVLRVVFEREVRSGELERLGRVLENGGLRAVVQVPRLEASRAAAALLNSFPVADLTIEEAAIDEIVRRLFAEGKKA